MYLGWTPNLSELVHSFEMSVIEDALSRNGGNVAKASETLGIPAKTLYDKLRRKRIEG